MMSSPKDASKISAFASQPAAATNEKIADPSASSAFVAPIELGIRNLPKGICNLVAGGMYGLKARTTSARFPLFSSLLQEVLSQDRPCYVVSPNEPASFLGRIELHWHETADHLIEAERLKVFSPQAEVPKKMFRYGADRFVQELESFGVSERSFLLYDQADDLISLHDPFLAKQQLEVLNTWCAHRRVTALLSFSRPSDRQADTFNSLMDYFTGIARLGGEKDGLELTFVYWKASQSLTVARNFHLSATEQGMYQAVEATASPPHYKAERPVSSEQAQASLAAPALPSPDSSYLGLAQSNPLERRKTAEMLVTPSSSPTTYLFNDPRFEAPLLQAAIAGKHVQTLRELVETAQGLPQAQVLLNVGAFADLEKMGKVIQSLKPYLQSSQKLWALVDTIEPDQEHVQALYRAGADKVITVQALFDNAMACLSQSSKSSDLPTSITDTAKATGMASPFVFTQSAQDSEPTQEWANTVMGGETPIKRAKAKRSALTT